LIDYELRVSPNVETLDVGLDGDSGATEEGLVLLHFVRRGEVQTHGVPHMFPEGKYELQARARLGFHHRRIKVKAPALGLDLHRG
jgi:hypothetical protein